MLKYRPMRLRAILVFLLLNLGAASSPAVIIDRIAALVDRQVITLSEVNQMVRLRVLARGENESEEQYRRRVLESMIAQALRIRDVERFGAEDVPKDSIEARLREVISRFSSETAFQEALSQSELSLDELRALIKRQIQVEAYVEERFSPLIFVSLEDIERYYTETWLPQRTGRGLAAVPLSEAREEIRDLLRADRLKEEIEKWTSQLRERANVDIYVFR